MEPVQITPLEQVDRDLPTRTVVVQPLEPDCLMGLQNAAGCRR
jgi:hypothetical protein